MRRSLTTIMLMGMAAAVLMAIAGSMFVGQVGGAEDVKGLRDDLKGLFGRQMVDQDALTIKVRSWEGRTGLVVEYAPVEALTSRRTRLEKHLGRVSTFILAQKEWKTKVDYVLLRAHLGGNRFHEKRYLRTPRE